MKNVLKRGQRELECLQKARKFVSTNNPTCPYLSMARPNPSTSNFPDFIFDEGFIEHFQVTSAKETAKGDKHKIIESKFETNSQAKFKQIKQEFLSSAFCPGTFSTNVLKMESPEYSYEYFLCSFKRNFESHIKSMNKYNGNSSISIFLVEFIGGRITVLRNKKFYKFYKIEYDKNLLSYLHEFKDKLKYLICFWGDTQGDLNGELSCEIIDMSRVPELLKKAPQNISFGVGRYVNHKLNIYFDI